MKHFLLAGLVAAFAFVLGCSKSDSTSPAAAATPDDVIVGSWISQAGDVAPLLVTLSKTTKIVATFNNNGTYTVVSTDSSNTTKTVTGTYATAAGGALAPFDTIRTIVCIQNSPALTASGIYQVTPGSPASMKYEVLQTQPPVSGYTQPTPAEGFGSTKVGVTKLGIYNIQKYKKQ